MRSRNNRQALRHRLATVGALISIVLLLGCGGGTVERTVTGSVKYGEKPVHPASIRFYPPTGRAAAAAIGPDGAFSLSLAPGTYKVAVVPGMNIPPGWKEGQPLPDNQPQVPTQYQSDRSTPLTVTVEAGGGALALPAFILQD